MARMIGGGDIIQSVHSGQRILTKGPIDPALVTPAAGESTLKPLFRRDALCIYKSAQPVLLRRLLLTRSNAFQWGGALGTKTHNTMKLTLSLNRFCPH